MRRFLEEYALAILVTFIILALVLMVSPIGKDIGFRLNSFAHQSGAKTENQIIRTEIRNEPTNINFEQISRDGKLRVTLSSKSKTDAFEIWLRYRTGSDWSDWLYLTEMNDEEFQKSLDFYLNDFDQTSELHFEDGLHIQVKAVDKGTNKEKESNEITLTLSN